MSKALKEIREEGIEEGIGMGIERGRAEGREEGIEEGYEECRADIIRNLYQSEMSVDDIASKTKVNKLKVLKILGITDSKDFNTSSAETSFFSKNTN